MKPQTEKSAVNLTRPLMAALAYAGGGLVSDSLAGDRQGSMDPFSWQHFGGRAAPALLAALYGGRGMRRTPAAALGGVAAFPVLTGGIRRGVVEYQSLKNEGLRLKDEAKQMAGQKATELFDVLKDTGVDMVRRGTPILASGLGGYLAGSSIAGALLPRAKVPTSPSVSENQRYYSQRKRRDDIRKAVGVLGALGTGYVVHRKMAAVRPNKALMQDIIRRVALGGVTYGLTGLEVKNRGGEPVPNFSWYGRLLPAAIMAGVPRGARGHQYARQMVSAGIPYTTRRMFYRMFGKPESNNPVGMFKHIRQLGEDAGYNFSILEAGAKGHLSQEEKQKLQDNFVDPWAEKARAFLRGAQGDLIGQVLSAGAAGTLAHQVAMNVMPKPTPASGNSVEELDRVYEQKKKRKDVAALSGYVGALAGGLGYRKIMT